MVVSASEMNFEPVADPLALVLISLMAINGTLGVSSAKVDAGDEAMDDGKLGKVIGKSEMSKTGTTAEQHTFPQEVEPWST